MKNFLKMLLRAASLLSGAKKGLDEKIEKKNIFKLKARPISYRT